jgi:ferredoxin
MNHCPVYQKIGGHAYGWVYPGPMGSVLTPSYVGLANAVDLPQAATLCGECNRVCPASIPLSDLLRKLREKQMERHLRPWQERMALQAWGYVARPRLYAFVTRMGARILSRMGGRSKLIASLPMAGKGWTERATCPPRAAARSANFTRKGERVHERQSGERWLRCASAGCTRRRQSAGGRSDRAVAAIGIVADIAAGVWPGDGRVAAPYGDVGRVRAG